MTEWVAAVGAMIAATFSGLNYFRDRRRIRELEQFKASFTRYGLGE